MFCYCVFGSPRSRFFFLSQEAHSVLTARPLRIRRTSSALTRTSSAQLAQVVAKREAARRRTAEGVVDQELERYAPD